MARQAQQAQQTRQAQPGQPEQSARQAQPDQPVQSAQPAQQAQPPRQTLPVMRAKSQLAVRFSVLLVAVLFVVVGAFSLWSIDDQESMSEQRALEEARLLAEQMNASWSYIDSVQSIINYDATGRYDFKGVYCSIAGKSIASYLTKHTDCVIRYTRENPRTGSDAPDDFEQQALAAFAADECEEYYALAEYDGESAFRYAAALRVTAGCLPCHGTPAGEIDETGYPREGMEMGDVAGAISLVIPMEQYRQEAGERIAAYIALFGLLVVVVVVCVAWGLRRWVMFPLGKLSSEARKIGSGDFVDSIDIPFASRETEQLAQELTVMSSQLKSTYVDLEQRVEGRTVQLREANEKLQLQSDEIASINQQLTETNRLLLEENEYKSIFLATMTHELRTPLVSIIAYTDIWLKDPQGRPAEDMALIRRIQRRSKELLETINNTLDTASLEAKQVQVSLATMDVYDVVCAVESLIMPLAREKGLGFAIRVEPGIPLVLCDASLVHKVLVNLLGNAAKFTEPGGSIELTVSMGSAASPAPGAPAAASAAEPAAAPGDAPVAEALMPFRQLVFTVSDTGIGIPEEDMRIVFERFRQADSSISRKYGGSGLGLYLAREMTELMGGNLQVKSNVGKGSVFTVAIPCRVVEGGADEDSDGR